MRRLGRVWFQFCTKKTVVQEKESCCRTSPLCFIAAWYRLFWRRPLMSSYQILLPVFSDKPRESNERSWTVRLKVAFVPDKVLGGLCTEKVQQHPQPSAGPGKKYKVSSCDRPLTSYDFWYSIVVSAISESIKYQGLHLNKALRTGELWFCEF